MANIFESSGSHFESKFVTETNLFSLDFPHMSSVKTFESFQIAVIFQVCMGNGALGKQLKSC